MTDDARCSNCKFYAVQDLECRRYAPRERVPLPSLRNTAPGSPLPSPFPHVGSSQWCGEYQPLTQGPSGAQSGSSMTAGTSPATAGGGPSMPTAAELPVEPAGCYCGPADERCSRCGQKRRAHTHIFEGEDLCPSQGTFTPVVTAEPAACSHRSPPLGFNDQRWYCSLEPNHGGPHRDGAVAWDRDILVCDMPVSPTLAALRAEVERAKHERDEARRAALAAGVVDPWAWMPDGENDLASMGEEMVVKMTAGTLRKLLAGDFHTHTFASQEACSLCNPAAFPTRQRKSPTTAVWPTHCTNCSCALIAIILGDGPARFCDACKAIYTMDGRIVGGFVGRWRE